MSLLLLNVCFTAVATTSLADGLQWRSPSGNQADASVQAATESAPSSSPIRSILTRRAPASVESNSQRFPTQAELSPRQPSAQIAQSVDPFDPNSNVILPSDELFDPFEEGDSGEEPGVEIDPFEEPDPDDFPEDLEIGAPNDAAESPHGRGGDDQSSSVGVPPVEFDPAVERLFDEPDVDPSPVPSTPDGSPAPQSDAGDDYQDFFNEEAAELFTEPFPEHMDTEPGEVETPEELVTPPVEQRDQLRPPRDGQFQTPLPRVEDVPPPAVQPQPPYSLDNSNLGIGDDIPFGLTEGDLDELEREQLAQDREKTRQECEDLRQTFRGDTINSISLDISLKGIEGKHYPIECGLGTGTFQPRQWGEVTFLWKASGLCHKPLYFEQPQLERYGHSWGPYLQPLVSGAHFFGTFPVLPYKMGIQTPNECVYTLGYYRPGSCAPYMIEAVPFTWRAALFEAGAWVGGAAAIP